MPVKNNNHVIIKKMNEKKSDKLISASLSGTFEGSVTLGMIIQLGIKYFVSAIHFKNLALQAEKSKDYEKYELYCINSVIMSYLALESFINEFFMSSIFTKESLKKHIDAESVDLLASHWETLKGSERTFQKYQYALLLSRKEPFDKGAQPYQDVDNLERLRNALIHFNPEMDTEQHVHARIEERLKNKFQLSRFLDGTDNPFFPSKCFSVGCCEWAIKSVTDFVNAFYDKLGIMSIIEYHKDTIKNWT